ncbi:PBP1A family penicillin-binding protein [Ectobacillus ponti]|uniref:PBP1A family penicillin-binding protein n=1 Tax=Ectobacillus ponti TaxID=2961894 RepID=A0AA41X6B9_9BACI|nr:PBP1A family penicillin-binding protein [Ectobacillus ponti]
MELIAAKTTKRLLRAFVIITTAGILSVGLLLLAGYGIARLAGPPPIAAPQTTTFYASDDSVLGRSDTGQARPWVSLDRISPYLREATISIEDQRFYEHHGFDFRRIGGALVADLKAMAKVQGASTITQQYARNLYLDHDKTWRRKAVEAVYTIRLEANYSKNEILEGYLNTIYYGHGAYGIEAASMLYFNKHARDLTLAESAMLAGIPKGPSLYSPYVSKERARGRQALILSAMREQGYITKTQEEEAMHTDLAFQPFKERATAGTAPYFQDVVQNVLVRDLNIPEQTIERGGLRVYTTLNPKLQKIAEDTVTNTIPGSTELETAVISMDPRTGEVKALLGGRDYQKSQFNRATQALRQPGSTFKPFLYYAALKQGFTPATRLKSEYTTFKMDDGVTQYAPTNYNNYYADDFVTMAQALAVSDNIYAVKTHMFLGMGQLVKAAKEFGITSPLHEVPSLALGTSPVRPIEMTTAYSMFANGGKRVNPVFIRRVTDKDGTILYDAHLEAEQKLSKETAFVMDELMTGMFNKKYNGYASVTGQTISGKLSRPYAGKSGSTSTDSWMIGFTPQLVTSVWTGYDRNKVLSDAAEQRYAKEIWVNVMEQGLADEPKEDFEKPSGVVGLKINPANGKLATKGCPVAVQMYFVKGTEPTDYCTEHLDGEDGFNRMKIKGQEDAKNGWWKKYFPW